MAHIGILLTILPSLLHPLYYQVLRALTFTPLHCYHILFEKVNWCIYQDILGPKDFMSHLGSSPMLGF